jgi:hypothetical protein
MSTSSKRQGKAQASGCWIRKSTRLAIYLRDRFTCAYCGRDLHGAAPADITLDHVVCRSAGGGNAPSNLVTACKSCNCKRGDAPVTAFASEDTVLAVYMACSTDLAPYSAQARALLAGQAPPQA